MICEGGSKVCKMMYVVFMCWQEKQNSGCTLKVRLRSTHTIHFRSTASWDHAWATTTIGDSHFPQESGKSIESKIKEALEIKRWAPPMNNDCIECHLSLVASDGTAEVLLDKEWAVTTLPRARSPSAPALHFWQTSFQEGYGLPLANPWTPSPHVFLAIVCLIELL